MYEVNQAPASAKFTAAWRAAAQHLQMSGGEGINWLRAELTPPLAEHLSFRIGNRLFFVYVEITGGQEGLSSKALFLKVASEATAIPAIMPMEETMRGFQPMYGGWGLRDVRTGLAIDPPRLVDDAEIEMSDWELHDFAVQVVASHLKQEGKEVFSKQPSQQIDPSIWFRDACGPAFVVVRSGRFPNAEVPRPQNSEAIAAGCAHMSRRGYFAAVSMASNLQPSSATSLPLLRGHGLVVRFTGLEQL